MDYTSSMEDVALTVVETPEFLSQSKRFLSAVERAVLVNFLSANPTAGDLIKGSGGARKLRWARAGMGKSGGCRVVYFYHSVDVPVFILTAFAKNAKINLSKAEIGELSKVLSALVDEYKKGVTANVRRRK